MAREKDRRTYLKRAKTIAEELFPDDNDEGHRRVAIAVLKCIYSGPDEHGYAEELLEDCIKAVDKIYDYGKGDMGKRIMVLTLFNCQWQEDVRH